MKAKPRPLARGSARTPETEHRITLRDVQKARRAFDANEPRDLFYRAASELVDLARRGASSLTVAESLAVLLQTWNKAYYQYRKFDNAHFAHIEKLLLKHRVTLDRYRDQAIEDLDHAERPAVKKLFQAFEDVLGPVGAAKALHLLAPRLFPLWDRAIAHAYELALGATGTNGERYWRFALIAQRQCRELEREGTSRGENPLKSIDEYNYCKHTRGWL